MFDKLITKSRLFMLSKLMDPEDRAFPFFAMEKWNIPLLREYRRALKYKTSITTENVKRTFIFSYSRSGTHNFAAKLHFLPGSFVLHENAFCRETDPYQLLKHPEDLKSYHFLALSMFAENGLQAKAGNRLSHLVYVNNKYLENETSLSSDMISNSSDYVIYYVRNIFRTLYSRAKAAERVNKDKPHWNMSDERFELSLRQHRRKLVEMLKLLDSCSSHVAWCFHEQFCAQPTAVMTKLCDFLSIPLACRNEWSQPKSFFTRCFGSELPPTIKDGALWCESRSQYIHGVGGKYNPLPDTSIDIAVKDPVKDILTPKRIRMATQLFGPSLVEFWMEDASFEYKTVSNEELIEIIRKSLPNR